MFLYDNTIEDNFIVFEGLDGVGKSIQSQLLTAVLKDLKQKVYLTCEPTRDTITGNLIRGCLKKEIDENDIPFMTSFMDLFTLDRKNHLYSEGGIVSRLRSGEVVICDRYLFSSLAYQGVMNPMSEIWYQNRKFPLPKIVFHFDAPINTILQRIADRTNTPELYETQFFLEKVKNNYDKIYGHLIENTDTKVIKIDSSNTIETVFHTLWEHVKSYLNINEDYISLMGSYLKYKNKMTI